MELISFLLFLLVHNALCEGYSSSDFECPVAKGRAYHMSNLPDVDYYVCVDGEFVETRSFADPITVDPMPEMFNTKVYEPPEKELPTYSPDVINSKRLQNIKPIFTAENIVWLIDGLINDFRYHKEKKSKSESSHEGETTLSPGEQTQSENIPVSTDSKPTESCDASLEFESDAPTTEHYINLKEDSSTDKTIDEKKTVEVPTIKSNSTEKLKEFSRKVAIPIIQDIVNDPNKMSKVAKVFRKYFQAVVPLATEVMEQSEVKPESGIRLPREQFVESLRKISNASLVLQEAALEILPSVLKKLSNHTDLLLDAIDETSDRFQISFFGVLFRSFMFLLKSSAVLEETSADEFVEFPSIFDIRSDIEAISKIVTEVTQDKMFYENINTATVMLQLLFF